MQRVRRLIAPAAFALVGLTSGGVVLADPGPAHVVVLGSSTAAGTGPSHPDSAWVRRFEASALALNPGNQVTNLAMGGYTTYHIQPTGSVPPPGRPAPDPARNITQALALAPEYIIINLPSNDAASGYPVAEQLANYDSVLVRAAAQSVPVWIATTQPRNLSTAGRANLMEMRDSTFARFGDYAADFWTTLALPGGTIDPAYDSGDGIHLNDAGHGILFERVRAEGILGENAVDAAPGAPDESGALRVRPPAPNPAAGGTALRFELGAASRVLVTLHDVGGRRLRTIENDTRGAGVHLLSVQRGALPAGVYFVNVRAGGGHAARRIVFGS